MWIRIEDISIKKVPADHLENPKNPDSPMALNLFQREARTAFYVLRNKKLYLQYIETPAGTRISKRKWTDKMETFAQQELANTPPQKGQFKVTIVGWIFLLLAFSTLGYLVYEGVQAPAKMKEHQEKLAEKATVAEGDIYFGHFEVSKNTEKLGRISSGLGFGWFKVVKIEGDIYHIVKSVEMSKTSKPKEQLNNSDFEQESVMVKAKELEAYHKIFTSEDGLIEIYFQEKKE